MSNSRDEANIIGAQRAAQRIISEYGISCPCEICIEDIAFARGVIVRRGSLHGAEGRLVRSGKRGVVRVRSNPFYPGRTRFAIAHELGHWEQHMHINQAWLCSSQEIHAYAGSKTEQEANAFAGELLMPYAMVQPRFFGGLSVETLRRVASEFETSLTATAVRAIDVTTEDAYVIFSKNGFVTWWRSSKRADRWISRNFSIRDNSFAYECNTSPDDSVGMRQTDIGAWFLYQDGDAYVEAWEESVCFSDLGTVMTLVSLA